MAKALSVDEFRKTAEAGKAKPVYFASGAEVYLFDELIRIVQERFVDDATRDFNYDIFHADSIAPQDLSAALKALPMMASVRVVILKHTELAGTALQKYLLEYASQPSPDTFFLMLYEGEANNAWGKKVLKAAPTITCDSPKGPALRKWVETLTSRYGLTIQEEALELIVSHPSIRLMDVQNELEKASLLLGEGGEITLEVMQVVWGLQPDVNIWVFFDRVASGRRKEAMRDLVNFGVTLDLEKEAGFFLSQIGRRLRLAWKEQIYDQQRIPSSHRAWSGKTDFQWRMASTMLKTLPSDKALQALQDVIDLDRERKSTTKSTDFLFQALLHSTALRRRSTP
ncbi:DNA polymerase III subunit delta [bacterium]|nr:DNA polymerase III subunit delta [bacterium]